MGYVAIRGGETAIQEAQDLLAFLRARDDESPAIDHEMISNQLWALHSRALSEGGLYHPKLASLAIKQSGGDMLEAAFYLRAYRSTRPRLGQTPPHTTGPMRVLRRISSAFKNVPGGQMLGPTPDYVQRLFRIRMLDESGDDLRQIAREWLADVPEDQLPDSFPKVIDALRSEGLLPPVERSENVPFDITREPLVFPLPRSASLAMMARAETGSILTLAYSNMRGYGDVHPTVAELRVGYVPVELPHLVTGEPVEAGEILMTECEMIAMHHKDDDDSLPVFGLGYGACFGHNEVKAISMAVLDRSLQKGLTDGPDNPSEDQEFVLLHIDGVESMGFCAHYKMPHYVTFQSDLDRLRAAQAKHGTMENPAP